MQKLCYHCMHQIENEKAHNCPKCGKSLKVQEQDTKFLRPGTVLQGKYIVGYPLGNGGFGNTYIGWNLFLQCKVAIKEFYPVQYSKRAEDGVTVSVSEESSAPRFQNGLQQFLMEARNVARLQDIRGVVAISNFFAENGTGYIVMEYLEGMDVKTILKKSGDKKDYEWCRRVVLTVLHTLRDIHKQGVLHRDIAPDNIFVTDEGIIKLIDFGAAKQESVSEDSRAEILLKAGYAPIEQYSRKTPQGPYTDLYAVAALFYRMLTGQKPIPANERLEKDSLIPPSDMGIELPEQAEMAIMVCLNVEAKYRLQSAEEFMEALDGKNFVPIYEPEWILPRVKERGLPVAAKAAICFGCICLLAGGIAAAVHFTNNASQNTDGLTSVSEAGMDTMLAYSGKTYEEAVSELEGNGFTNVAEPVYAFSSEEEGVIIAQNIEPSEEIDLDEEIIFTVSGGDSKYTMSDFTGKSEEEIIQYFTEKNYAVIVSDYPVNRNGDTERYGQDAAKVRDGIIIISRVFDRAAEGICVGQSVSEGELCSADMDVEFSVSVGGTKKDFDRKMPDLTGLTEDEAIKKLEKKGLIQVLEIGFQTYSQAPSNVAAGTVFEQSIKAGEKINLFEDDGMKLTIKIKKAK